MDFIPHVRVRLATTVCHPDQSTPTLRKSGTAEPIGGEAKQEDQVDAVSRAIKMIRGEM